MTRFRRSGSTSAPWRDARPGRVTGVVLLGASLLLGGLTACTPGNTGPDPSVSTGSTTAAPRPLLVGATTSLEGVVLAQLYADALVAKGVPAKVQAGFESQRDGVAALKDGRIDVFPTFTGSLLAALDSRITGTGDDAVMNALKQATPTTVKLLDTAEARSQVVFAITQVTAEHYQIKSLDDATKNCPKLVVAAPSDFLTDDSGLGALRSAYKCDPKQVLTYGAESGPDSGPLFADSAATGPYTIPQPLKSLLEDSSQVAVLSSSDPAVEDNALVTLNDPKGIVRPEVLIPAVSAASVTQSASDAINSVTRELKQEDLTGLNRAAQERGTGALADIVMSWLKSKNLSK